MKSKILFISLAVVLALSIGLVGCNGGGPAGATEIVIGMSRSLTGPLAIIHQSAFGSIYPAYVAVTNGGGGITVDGTAFDVNTKIYNDNSEETKLIANANALVDDVADGVVHTIFGPDSTHFIDVMAPICNNGGCVMMSVEGGATFLEEPGYLPEWPYVFINLSFSDWYQLPILAPMLSAAGASSAYLFLQDDAHGLEYGATALAYFPSNGISIVGNASVINAPTPPDYASLVATANATSPDVVCCFCYPDEILGLTGAAIGGGYNFDGWVVGPGGCFGWFGDPTPVSPPLPPGLGANAEGIITFAVANNKTNAEFQNLYNNILGPPGYTGELGFQDFWGHPLYWAALQVWQEAVENVGVVTEGLFSIDQDDLKDEIRSYNSPGSAVTTILGPTYYTMFPLADIPMGPTAGSGGGIMAYQCHTGEIGQWQSGYCEVIGGATNTSSLDYPKDDWV